LPLKAPRDPGFAALRRASRAAIVIPAAFAFGALVLRDPQNVIFIVFGCFALLVMSDFGGFRPRRAVAYLTATLVGAVLVALGTLVSPHAVLETALMFIVGFAISFARVFGGYAAAAQTGMLLAFVIAVSIPAPADEIPTRVGGWLMAGTISTLAAVFLWPRFERVTLAKQAAKALRAIADLVASLAPGAGDQGRPQLIEAARLAEKAAQREYAVAAKRPAGPARRERAFVELLGELQRIVDLIEQPFDLYGASTRAPIDESARLVAATVAALRASADVLTGGAPPHVTAVAEARDVHRAALDEWAAKELRTGRPAQEVLDGLAGDHTLRVVAYVTVVLASNAVIAAGGRPDPDLPLPEGVPRLQGLGGGAIRIWRTITTHLEPNSTITQNSLRVASGLAVAVLLARQLGLQHSFWVVLGTLQVLRSNALGTGRTTIQALAGNVIGVVIGGAFAAAAGNNPVVMWVTLPVVVFLAAYAATTVGFVVSQAAFTINLIVVFNLISPAGWQIGLVRIEDVAIGAAISVVVGVLFWPRGARRELARGIAGFYHAVGIYLDHAFDRVLGIEEAGGADAARGLSIQARDRAAEAFDAFLNEKAPSPLDPQTAGSLLSAGNQALLAADVLDVVSGRMGYQASGCPDGARIVHEQVDVMLAAFLRLADQLALSELDQHPARITPQALRGAALHCLSHWRNDDQAGRGALAVVIAAEWVQNLARMEDDVDRSVAIAVAAARTPWWR